MARVSVIMATYNNAPYLRHAVDSVLRQTDGDWELVIVDDASTDNTGEVLQTYRGDPRIRILRNSANLGLCKTCNVALKAATGEYVMRLDGDDFLDENAIAVLAMALDRKPEVDLVDCDHYLVDEDGEVLECVRRKKFYEEVEVLDLPPISTAVMIRKRCYDALNGYNEELACQDTYDFWMRFIQKFQAYNVSLPLWYYRQHPGTLTTNKEKILRNRRHAKNSFVEKEFVAKNGKPRVLAIIPMRAASGFPFKLALHKVGGQPLISHVIRTAKSTRMLDKVVFTTEDLEIAESAREHGVEVILRPPELAAMKTPIESTVVFVLAELEKRGYRPDIVAILHANSPMLTHSNIEEAVNTLLIYHTDSVISVMEDKKLHYIHDKYGLTPIFKKRKVRLEREELYEENGAVYVSRREAITPDSFFGRAVGHVIMTPEESLHIDTPFDLRVAEMVFERRKSAATARH